MLGRKLKLKDNSDAKVSYSQQGEDLIMAYVLSWLGNGLPRYLDIGAHHPTFLSNTYYFYQLGCRGVCVEPDPILATNFSKKRPEDKVLNIGVGTNKARTANFFVMEPTTLNTFSESEAKLYQSHYPGSRISRKLQIKLEPINDIIQQYFQSAPNLISIDTEGLDLEILKNFDFKRWRPEVFCVETITYTGPNSLKKNQAILKLMAEHDYLLYADTFINSIFVDLKLWKQRQLPRLEQP